MTVTAIYKMFHKQNTTPHFWLLNGKLLVLCHVSILREVCSIFGIFYTHQPFQFYLRLFLWKSSYRIPNEYTKIASNVLVNVRKRFKQNLYYNSSQVCLINVVITEYSYLHFFFNFKGIFGFRKFSISHLVEGTIRTSLLQELRVLN